MIQYCLRFVLGDNVFLPVILQKLMCKNSGHYVLVSRYQAEIFTFKVILSTKSVTVLAVFCIHYVGCYLFLKSETSVFLLQETTQITTIFYAKIVIYNHCTIVVFILLDNLIDKRDKNIIISIFVLVSYTHLLCEVDVIFNIAI